jgi:hypothetical protein
MNKKAFFSLCGLFLSIGFLMPLFNSCDRILGGEDDRLRFINNSYRRIYAIEQINYPDTSINNYNPTNDKSNYEVLPNSSKNIKSYSWPQLVISSNDTIMFFVYDANVLETTSWDTVRKNYLILKRYEFSMQDLIDLDWTITYP